nr:hypothetical protein [Pedobacter sp. ASV19]
MGIIETEKMLNIEQGIEIGRSQEKEHFVANLIATFGFSNEQAAKAADASISFVKKIRSQLKKGIN